MSHSALEQARRDRNAALIDVMVLAASADTTPRAAEMKALIGRVIERPEFEGTDAHELNLLVEGSARRLSHARGLDDILTSLRQRLPDHRNRLLAFGLAASVALADRRATRTELGLLKSVQAALGVSEEEVTRVFETVEEGRSLSDALGEPLERLYAETMVIVSASDGVVNHRELKVMLENMAGDPLFRDVSLEAAQQYLGDAAQGLALEGVAARLTALAQGLTTHPQRLRAYRLAVHIACAEGKPSVAAKQALDQLQATFGLRDTEVERISGENAS